jgi:NhaP-type Na+/H+ or K+/H+ antiporter
VLSTFRGQPISISTLFHGLGLFLFVFTFSMALGVCFGLGCSLMLKHSRLSAYPQLESCLVALIAYTSYFFSNGVGMGGESGGASVRCAALTTPPARHRLAALLRHHAQALRLP